MTSLITELRAICIELKDEEKEAARLAKQRPEDELYFKGLEIGRMQARIELESLIEKHGNSRPMTLEMEL